jgi:cellulose synthase/poly-beta-1,6-N-acetylglucosamine synthase-like glycosyltransferase
MCGSHQRRRWINGAFFSSVFYVFKFRGMVLRSSHSLGRLGVLFFQFLYNISVLVLAWFSVGSYFLCLMLVYHHGLRNVSDSFRQSVLLAVACAYGLLSILQVHAVGCAACGLSLSVASSMPTELTFLDITASRFPQDSVGNPTRT